MAPLISTAIEALVGSIINQFFPNASEAKKAELQVKLQVLINQSELAKGNLEVNKAEADNPNRKYPTWRECLGYVAVITVAYHLVILPFIVSVINLCGGTVKMEDLPHIDISQIVKILLGMLGISSL